MIDPSIDTAAAAWIAPSAELYGDVRIATGVSIWPKAVLRAEAAFIEIGAHTNLQDFVMVHFGADTPSVIGANCSITHHCTIHGATVGNNCLIGINATLMDGCEIGDNSIVAGNSIVREGAVFAPNSIIAGVPAKQVAQRNNAVANELNAIAYFENAKAYARGNYRRWSEPEYARLMQDARTRLEAAAAS